MNLADSMHSQHNINKVVSQEKEKYNLCLWIEWQIFPFADNINKLPKKTKDAYSDNQPQRENAWGEGDVHISAWDLKRQYKVCNFVLNAEIRLRDPLVTRANISAPLCVFSGRCSNPHKGSLPQKKDICELSLWLYSYFTQTSPSKNKNKITFLYIYESFVVRPAVQNSLFSNS